MRDWVIEREDNATRAAAKLDMLDGSIGWRKKVVDEDQYDIMSVSGTPRENVCLAPAVVGCELTSPPAFPCLQNNRITSGCRST